MEDNITVIEESSDPDTWFRLYEQVTSIRMSRTTTLYDVWMVIITHLGDMVEAKSAKDTSLIRLTVDRAPSTFEGEDSYDWSLTYRWSYVPQLMGIGPTITGLFSVITGLKKYSPYADMIVDKTGTLKELVDVR